MTKAGARTGVKALPRIYYGWIIVGVALVSMGFWLGIRPSFSVFYVALLEEFPWNRGAAAGVQSMALIAYSTYGFFIFLEWDGVLRRRCLCRWRPIYSRVKFSA